MRRKQRKRQLEQRQAHQASVGRPENVLSRRSYSTVKQGHIVPATYQRNFAIDDEVAVHVPGRSTCLVLDVQKAGTRSRFYRRIRPDGSQIDDVEASLDVLESKAGPVLAEVAEGAVLTSERRDVITQFLGMQMHRGPASFAEHERQVRAVIRRELTAREHVKPALWSATGGNMELARERVIAEYLHPTRKLLTMSALGMRAAAVLGSMRWHLLRFEAPVLAYSDQPVVVWPAETSAIVIRSRTPNLTPLNALEVRVPLSPWLALLMTWSDEPEDGEPRAAPETHAGEMNALVIAQADKQWMHRPGAEPPVAGGTLQPLSPRCEPAYSPQCLPASRRRAAAERFLRRVQNKLFLNNIEVANVRRSS